jgi:hypothetical protein
MAIHAGGKTYTSMTEMLEDWERSRTVWDKIKGVLWYVPRGRAIDAKYKVKWAYQRVVRGWDDRAEWDIAHTLPYTLGSQLVSMSECAHGVPCDYIVADIPDSVFDERFVAWKAVLRKHGEALLAFHNTDDLTDKAAWDAAYAPAQEALHWVADNLATIWD